MKFADINKRYTEIVAEYIAKGFTINTATMSGHQGEIAKIDLTDGSEIVRILVQSFSDWRANVEGIEIVVGTAMDDVQPHGNDKMRDTIWTYRLGVHNVERFYCLGRYGEDIYGTEQEAKEAADLRCQRYCNRERKNPQYNPSAKAMEIAKRIVREKMGYKRVTASEVELTKNDRGYTVSYKGKSYRLH